MEVVSKIYEIYNFKLLLLEFELLDCDTVMDLVFFLNVNPSIWQL